MYFICVERTSYWIFWIAATIYALYEFSKICQSDSHFYRLNIQDFRDGTLSKNPYDASDFEWQSFKKLYVNYWYIFLIHFGLSNVFTAYNQPTLRLASWILIGIYATYTVFSMAALILVVINITMLVLLAILGKNILSYALCFGVVLASQTTEISNRLFNPNDPRQTYEFDFEEKRFLFTWCLCFLNARGLSSSIDNLKEKPKKEIQSGKDQFYDKLVTIVAYLLYLPGFFAGPIYLYNDFEKATRLVRAEPGREAFLGSKYFKSMTAVFILIANIIYYEWMLHWIYSSAVIHDNVLLSGYNNIQFSGLIVSLCLLFYMRYTCMYGTFKVLATLDGVASIAPPLPQCVGAMHLNSQLWRNFDVGIYTWLRRYIYDPIASIGKTVFTRFLATLVCFMCIALWHLPLTPNLILWIGLNIVSAFVELWCKSLVRTAYYAEIRSKISRANFLRLLALVSLPMFTLAIYSNLFFLSTNEQASYEFMRRLMNNSGNYAIYMLAILYCGVNVSLDYNKVVKSDVDLAACHGFPVSKKAAPKASSSSKHAKRN